VENIEEADSFPLFLNWERAHRPLCPIFIYALGRLGFGRRSRSRSPNSLASTQLHYATKNSSWEHIERQGEVNSKLQQSKQPNNLTFHRQKCRIPSKHDLLHPLLDFFRAKIVDFRSRSRAQNTNTTWRLRCGTHASKNSAKQLANKSFARTRLKIMIHFHFTPNLRLTPALKRVKKK
jgi:hypothetical protein